MEVRAIRLSPYLYAHGDTLNSLQQRGFAMAHPLGGNGEELSLKAKKWLPVRSWIQVGYSEVRKGSGPVDPETGLHQNLGGGFSLGSGPGNLGFLEGTLVQRYSQVEVEGVAEILRGVRVSVGFQRRVSKGGEYVQDQDRMEVGVTFRSPLAELIDLLVPYY